MTQAALWFTGEDLITAIEEASHDYQSEAYDKLADFWYEDAFYGDGQKFDIPNIGEIEVLEGYRESGEYKGRIYTILKHIESDRIFLRHGYWESYDGTHWDGVMEVVKKPVTIEAWVDINTGERFIKEYTNE